MVCLARVDKDFGDDPHHDTVRVRVRAALTDVCTPGMLLLRHKITLSKLMAHAH